MDREKRIEEEWEKKLNIRTAGGYNHAADGENYPYEPTPYSVLLRLAESGYLSKNSRLIDYGCGKGRAAILLAALTGCRVTGIDYSENLIREAKDNLLRNRGKHISFIHADAQKYELTDEDSFFFFNPFSEVILKRVLDQILWSWYENPRRMQLFFYFPMDEDVAFLSGIQELMFMDEIDCSDLFEGNQKRERILIFESMPEETITKLAL